MQTRDNNATELKNSAHLALPDAQAPHPGVVIIHEAYGLNDQIKGVARRFAEQGYAALAVDLFAGRNRAICMARLMTGLLTGAVNRYGIDDLKSALTMLAGLPEVDGHRVGAIGFCMGGSLAIAWACTDSRLKAIAPFYATNPRPLEAVKRMCPVVGSYPADDFTARAGRTLDAALTRFDLTHDIKTYPNTRHSFFNETRSTYDRDAASDAWSRVMRFFGSQLGSSS